jgi:hypothetical protein
MPQTTMFWLWIRPKSDFYPCVKQGGYSRCINQVWCKPKLVSIKGYYLSDFLTSWAQGMLTERHPCGTRFLSCFLFLRLLGLEVKEPKAPDPSKLKRKATSTHRIGTLSQGSALAFDAADPAESSREGLPVRCVWHLNGGYPSLWMVAAHQVLFG